MMKHLNLKPQLPSRTVVFGAGGFVGQAVIRHLKMLGAPFLALTRKDIDLLSSDAADKIKSHLREGDSVVIASAIAPCKTLSMFRENIIIVEALLKSLKGAPISHVVNISSDAVYGDEDLPLTENCAMAPISLHGVMHHARELAFASELKVPIASLRPTLIYGAADPHNGYGPNLFRRLAQKNETIVLFGEGEERRDHVYIDDVAEIIFRVLAHRSEGSLNIATGEVVSFKEIAEQTINLLRSSSAIITTERTGKMPHNGYRPFSIAACSSAFPDFHYIKIPEGLKKSFFENEN